MMDSFMTGANRATESEDRPSIFGYKKKRDPKPVSELIRKFKDSGKPKISTRIVNEHEFDQLA